MTSPLLLILVSEHNDQNAIRVEFIVCSGVHRGIRVVVDFPEHFRASVKFDTPKVVFTVWVVCLGERVEGGDLCLKE